jgi:hypothetical protein
MVMQDQARRLREPLRWGRREKGIVGALLGVLAAAAVALIVFAASSGAPARADCINLSFPSTLGAGYVKGCGAKARAICASGAYRGSFGRELQAACARAGFAYRSPE